MKIYKDRNCCVRVCDIAAAQKSDSVAIWIILDRHIQMVSKFPSEEERDAAFEGLAELMAEGDW